MGNLEKNVKAGISRYLKRLKESGEKIKWFRYSAFGGEPGVSDTICCIRGHFVGIEAKRPDRKTHKDGGQSPYQREFEKTIQAAGGDYILAYDWRDVRDYFNKRFALLTNEVC